MPNVEVTFSFPSTKIQYFVNYYGMGYEQKVQENTDADPEVLHPDVVGKTKAEYARDQAEIFLINPVRTWHRQEAASQLPDIDMTTP